MTSLQFPSWHLLLYHPQSWFLSVQLEGDSSIWEGALLRSGSMCMHGTKMFEFCLGFCAWPWTAFRAYWADFEQKPRWQADRLNTAIQTGFNALESCWLSVMTRAMSCVQMSCSSLLMHLKGIYLLLFFYLLYGVSQHWLWAFLMHNQHLSCHSAIKTLTKVSPPVWGLQSPEVKSLNELILCTSIHQISFCASLSTNFFLAFCTNRIEIIFAASLVLYDRKTPSNNKGSGIWMMLIIIIWSK